MQVICGEHPGETASILSVEDEEVKANYSYYFPVS